MIPPSKYLLTLKKSLKLVITSIVRGHQNSFVYFIHSKSCESSFSDIPFSFTKFPFSNFEIDSYNRNYYSTRCFADFADFFYRKASICSKTCFFLPSTIDNLLPRISLVEFLMLRKGEAVKLRSLGFWKLHLQLMLNNEAFCRTPALDKTTIPESKRYCK